MSTTPYDIARRFVGTREIPGPKHNPMVLAWLRAWASWVNSDETPWCSAFANFCAKEAGYEHTGSLAARSWLNVGQEIPTSHAIQGDVVVFWRGSPRSWQGHVAFFIRWRGEYAEVLGGNQSDSVCTAIYPKSQILGVRRLRRVRAAA